jgi:hypothetical protein
MQALPVQPDAHGGLRLYRRISWSNDPHLRAGFQSNEDEEVTAAVLDDIHPGGKVSGWLLQNRDVVRTHAEDGVG